MEIKLTSGNNHCAVCIVHAIVGNTANKDAFQGTHSSGSNDQRIRLDIGDFVCNLFPRITSQSDTSDFVSFSLELFGEFSNQIMRILLICDINLFIFRTALKIDIRDIHDGRRVDERGSDERPAIEDNNLVGFFS